MNCSACGKPNSDGVSFCEFCGAPLRPRSTPNGEPVVSRPTPAQPAPPSAAEVAQMGKSLVGSLSLGEKFIGVGTIAAVLGFFLPWISTPDLGMLSGLFARMGAAEASHVSISGVDAAKVVGSVYFILLAGIASGVLFYFSRKALFAQKLLISGFHVMIGSLLGPLLIALLLFIPMIQSVAGFGFWLLGLGFCSITAGGLISIAALAKTAR